MLSRSSLLPTLKLGCLNSRVYTARTTIVCLSHFVEIVLVQLPDKTRHVAVLEVLWEDRASEFFVLGMSEYEHDGRHQFKPYLNNNECVTILAPSSDILMRWVLKHS